MSVFFALMLGFIMVVSLIFWIYYGAVSFAHMELCRTHESSFAKYGLKTNKLFARYNKMCYRYCFKRLLVSFTICIISLIVGYLTL